MEADPVLPEGMVELLPMPTPGLKVVEAEVGRMEARGWVDWESWRRWDDGRGGMISFWPCRLCMSGRGELEDSW